MSIHINKQLIIFVVENYFMILYPNAKINIGLNIESRRSDGYHNISSVFYPTIDFFDIIEIIESADFLFTSSGIPIPNGVNLCEKAYLLIKEKYKIPPVHIHLHKIIPIGSGLGGGSSDASFTLKGLNILFNLNISNNELENLALYLGADCPFFISNTPKYITGVGEVMRDINLDLSSYNIRLINNDIHISTQDAYSQLELCISNSFLEEFIDKPVDLWKDNITNDFEKSIFRTYPILKKNKQELYEDGAIYSSMTGTGSTIYGLFNKE